jgi:hypothetical protein
VEAGLFIRSVPFLSCTSVHGGSARDKDVQGRRWARPGGRCWPGGVRVQGWRDSRRGGCSNSCWRRFCSGGEAQEEERRWLLQGRAQGGARQGRDAGERCRARRGRGRRTR